MESLQFSYFILSLTGTIWRVYIFYIIIDWYNMESLQLSYFICEYLKEFKYVFVDGTNIRKYLLILSKLLINLFCQERER